MDLVDIEHEMARLDTVYRPVATEPVDVADPDVFTTIGATIQADLARLAVDDQAEAVLRAVIDLYTAGDETVRTGLRRLFDRYASFRWAAHLPRAWDSAEDFRARLVHISARDQGADTRDEVMALQDLCTQARQAGIDIDPILTEVAAISSNVDRYGMGSMRSIILRHRRPRAE